MAWQDRAYYRDSSLGGGGLMGRLGSHSMVTWLLALNFIVWVLDSIITHGTRTAALSPFLWGNFNFNEAVLGLQLWRWVTYQFLHIGFLHLLFNMIGLFFFGPMLEQWWGSKRFLAFYLICGISGAFIMLVLAMVPGLLGVGPTTPLVGASGALFGILAAAAVLYPHQRVMLIFPPIPMSLRTMALIFLGIAVLTVLAGGQNAGGQAAHLGGALMGFLLVKSPHMLNWADRISFSGIRQKQTESRWQKKQQQLADEEAEVDRILDKVRDHGLQSLTRKEKKTLSRATERKRHS